MSGDYDPEEFELCGVLYKATRQQANDIFASVMLTKEWSDYAVSNDRIRYGEMSATDPEAVKLIEQHVDNYRKAFKAAKKIIDGYLTS